jgi:hypothetical protein
VKIVSAGQKKRLINKESGIELVKIKRHRFLEEQIEEHGLMLTSEDGAEVHLLNGPSITFYRSCDNATPEDASERYINAYSALNVSEEKLRADAYKIYKMLKEKAIIYEEDTA